jgi:glycosyltransferase involved in cell wall biosynthesis
VFFSKIKKNNISECRKIVSIVLGSYNRLDFLKLTIESIRQEVKDLSHEIIVVDGGSQDGALQWLVAQKDIITIVQHNRGEWLGKNIERRSWGYFMNLAFKCAQGKFVCMLSDDCLLVPGSIINGIKAFDNSTGQGKKIGAIAFYWRNWSQQEKYYVGCTLGNKIYVNHGMYLTQALKAVDYIDENNFFFYNADGDLCLKMWHAGYECIESPESFVEHYPHANIDIRKTNYEKYNQDNKNYLKKWDNIFYNKKLNNLGMLIEKEFEDITKTGDKFNFLHQQAIASNPKLIRTASALKKIKRDLYWKFKAFVRRLFN